MRVNRWATRQFKTWVSPPPHTHISEGARKRASLSLKPATSRISPARCNAALRSLPWAARARGGGGCKRRGWPRRCGYFSRITPRASPPSSNHLQGNRTSWRQLAAGFVSAVTRRVVQAPPPPPRSVGFSSRVSLVGRVYEQHHGGVDCSQLQASGALNLSDVFMPTDLPPPVCLCVCVSACAWVRVCVASMCT